MRLSRNLLPCGFGEKFPAQKPRMILLKITDHLHGHLFFKSGHAQNHGGGCDGSADIAGMHPASEHIAQVIRLLLCYAHHVRERHQKGLGTVIVALCAGPEFFYIRQMIHPFSPSLSDPMIPDPSSISKGSRSRISFFRSIPGYTSASLRPFSVSSKTHLSVT